MKLGIVEGKTSFREARTRVSKVFAQVGSGKKLPNYKCDPLGSSKVSKLGGEVALCKAKLQMLKQNSARLCAAEAGVAVVERSALGLQELLNRVLSSPFLAEEELDRINEEKDRLVESINLVANGAVFGGERLLGGGVVNLSVEELGLAEFEFARPISEAEAEAEAEEFLNDKDKIKEAQRVIERGINSVQNLAWGAMSVFDGTKGKLEVKAAAVKKLVLFYKTEGNGGKRGDVAGEFPGVELKAGNRVVIGGNVEIADNVLENFAEKMHGKIMQGGDKEGKNPQKGFGNGLMRKHFYNFGISAAFRNMPKGYKQFANVVSKSIYDSVFDGGGETAESNRNVIASAVLGEKDEDGLYRGGAFGVGDDGRLAGEAHAEVMVARAVEDAEKARQQQQKISDVLKKVKRAKLELATTQGGLECRIESVQQRIDIKQIKVSTLSELDPNEAQVELSTTVAELIVSMHSFCILLQNRLYANMQLASLMEGALDSVYGGQW